MAFKNLSYQDKIAFMKRKQQEAIEARKANDLKKFEEILNESKSAVGIRPAWNILIDGQLPEVRITEFKE